MGRKSVRVGVLVAAIVLGWAFQAADDAKTQLEKAKYLMETKGDVEGAIKTLQKIIADYPKDRAAAAEAQLSLGICYEKLEKRGGQEAQRAFEKVIADYPEQTGAVKAARERLDAMRAAAGPAADAGALRLRQVWTGRDVSTGGSISPDGRYLSFTDPDDNLSLRDLSTRQNRILAKIGKPGSIGYVFSSKWSPDGKSIAFGWIDYDSAPDKLYLWDIGKNASRVLYADPDQRLDNLLGWSKDAKLILISTLRKGGIQGELGLVSIVDGSYRTIKKYDNRAPNNGQCSPDGRFILFNNSLFGAPKAEIRLLLVDTGEEKVLFEHPAYNQFLDWTPDGRSVLFVSDRAGSSGLWSLDMEGERPVGAPKLLKDNIGSVNHIGLSRDGSYFFSVSKVGRDAYSASVNFQTGKLLSDPQKISRVFEGRNQGTALSPDGHLLAFSSYRGPQRNIYEITGLSDSICVYSFASKDLRDFQVNVRILAFSPLRWSPDGRFIYFREYNAANGGSIQKLDVETGRVSMVFQNEDKQKGTYFLSPDEHYVYMSWARRSDTDPKKFSHSILKHDIALDKDMELFKSDQGTAYLSLSPDSKTLAFVSAKKLLLLPTQGGEAKELMKAGEKEGFYSIGWTQDSQTILLTKTFSGKGDEINFELWKVGLDGSAPLKTELSQYWLQNASLLPDGKTVAYTAGEPFRHEIWCLENFLPKK